MNSRRPRTNLSPAPTGWRQPIRTYGILLGVGIAAVVPVCQQPTSAVAQEIAQLPADRQLSSEMNVLYVNSAEGSDVNGLGDDRTPFKTITHALQVAQPNTIILLSQGTYSVETGESFPLMLKPGITIQGDPQTKGRNILIRGGGYFLSRSFGGQNVAIAGANQASLIGITLTNPNPRGYGLWTESTSPYVADNTFTENTHDGVSVNGTSAPVIRSNYFYRNGGNGITVYGTSTPEVRENVIENTGFGINAAQNSAPQLIGNRIINNKDGVVVESNAQPVLRNNIIENNYRYGLVAISQSRPDLGTPGEPGGNIFRANGQLDINAKVARQVIPAYGNQLSTRTEGRIDRGGVASQSSFFSDDFNSTPSAVSPQPYPQSAAIDIPAEPPAASYQKPKPVPQAAPVPPAPTPRQKPVQRQSGRSTGRLPMPQPPQTVPTFEFSADAPPVQSSRQVYSAEAETPDILPVSNSDIPVGNTRGGSPYQSTDTPQALGLRYRVVVEAQSSADEALVRSLIPGAFYTLYNGRDVLQVGVFSNRNNAEQRLQMLTDNGLNAAIEPLSVISWKEGRKTQLLQNLSSH